MSHHEAVLRRRAAEAAMQVRAATEAATELAAWPPLQADLVRTLTVLARTLVNQQPLVILDIFPVREDATEWCCGVSAPVLVVIDSESVVLPTAHLCVRCACETIRGTESRYITAEVRNPAVSR